MNMLQIGGTPNFSAPSIDTVPAVKQINFNSSLLGDRVERDSAVMVRDPISQGSQHNPFAHIAFVREVEQQLSNIGFSVFHAEHAVSGDNGARYFGLMQVYSQDLATGDDDWSTLLGLRSSHDKTIGAQLVLGDAVFVCSNLCFFGGVKASTKHTTNVLARLPETVAGLVRTLPVAVQAQQARIDAYKRTDISVRLANAAMTQLVRIGAISGSMLPKVIQEFDKPSHDEFAEHMNVWRLRNAVTEAFKPTGERTTVHLTAQRGPKLETICNQLSGYQVA